MQEKTTSANPPNATDHVPEEQGRRIRYSHAFLRTFRAQFTERPDGVPADIQAADRFEFEDDYTETMRLLFAPMLKERHPDMADDSTELG